MRPLTATECISPAIQRTKDLLARPFRTGTYLKLTALAVFAEMGGSCNFSVPGNRHQRHDFAAIHPYSIPFIVAAVVVGVAIWVALFYLSSRLQLVLAEIVAARQQYVAPFWRRQAASAWRWIGLKLVFFVAVAVIAVILASPIIFYAIRHRMTSGFSHLPVGWMVFIVAMVLLLVLVAAAAYGVLRGLVLPPMALEGVPASEAIRRARFIVDTEPGQLALFILLEVLLSIAMAIAAEIIIVLVGLISLLPLGLIGGGAWLTLRHAGAGGTVLLIALAIAGGIVFVGWMVCVAIGLLGPVQIFTQAYALYFLGGRYPLLGDLLDQTTPVPDFFAPPGFIPPPIAPPQPGLSL